MKTERELAIAAVPAVAEAVRGLCIGTDLPTDTVESVEILGATNGVDQAGRIYEFAPIHVYRTRAAAMSTHGLAKRVAGPLARAGHVAAERVAPLVLGMIATLPDVEDDPIGCANRVLDSMTSWDVTQVWTTALPVTIELDVAEYHLGKINTERLRHRCEKAKSDFYVRYADDLARSWGIERAFFSAKIIPFSLFKERRRQRVTPEVGYALTDGYMQTVAAELFGEFWEQFRARMAEASAIGGTRIGAEVLRQTPLSRSITVLLRQDGGGGWVAPNTKSPRVTFPAGKGVDRIRLALAAVASKPPSSPDPELEKTWRAYCGFVDRAWAHRLAEREDEALLHLVIAFEVLFSERTDTSDAVARRVAAASYVHVREPFAAVRKRAAALYNARSRFVHSGETPDVGFAEAVILSRAVARSLMNYRARAPANGGALAEWRRKLDLLVATIDAGETVDDGFLAKLGLSPVDVPLEGATD